MSANNFDATFPRNERQEAGRTNRLLRFAAAIALGVCAAGLLASPGFSAGGAAAFEPIAAISYVIGSKRAIGYFVRQNGECRLTLMIAEAGREDSATAPSAARLRLFMQPGQSADLASVEGEAIVVTCGEGAAKVYVARRVESGKLDAARPSVARRTPRG